VLEWDGPGPADTFCATQPASPRTTPDIANDITIAAELMVLVRCIINNGVYPASEEFPTRTTIPSNVTVEITLPHGYIEVPCYDETITGGCVENTLWGWAVD